MSDRDWLVPGIGLTLLSGALGLALIPSYSGILPALAILPFWMIAAGVLGTIYGVFALNSAGVERPFAYMRGKLISNWRPAALLTSYVLLCGLNMTTFMWVKPLLNYLVAFSADPFLADLDHAVFLGRDPWTLLTWLNSAPLAIFYHRGWFALMVLTLVAVLSARPSPEKSALMVTYFVLWSVVGPLIHALVPAAGPVFYAQLGYGDRFAGLVSVPETREIADYLWGFYAGQGFGPGSGISAMPSLHNATAVWIVIAINLVVPRWTKPMAAAALLIFLLSISLGWHYAVDGLVGGVAAVLCYRILRSYYRARAAKRWDAGRIAAETGTAAPGAAGALGV